MKVILHALEENIDKPQPRWWGIEKGNVRCLMRYGEMLLAWNIHTKKILHKEMCTITDKRGIAFAINYLKLIE